MPIVILGGGIIGLSTAYYLSKFTSESTPTQQTASLSPHIPYGPNPPSPSANYNHHAHGAHRHRDRSSGHHHHHHHHHRPQPNLNVRDNSIHVIEPSPELFSSASGKAAGFLARDWFGPAVAPLGAFSFDLHRQLAKEEGGREKWGWCESVAYSMDREDECQQDDGAGDVRINGDRNGSANRSGEGVLSDSRRANVQGVDDLVGEDADQLNDEEFPAWIRAHPSSMQAISDRSTTAQVDPLRLCQFLYSECVKRGVTIHHPARATKLLKQDPNDPHSPTLIRIQYLENEQSFHPRNGAEDTASSSGGDISAGERVTPAESGAGGDTGTTIVETQFALPQPTRRPSKMVSSSHSPPVSPSGRRTPGSPVSGPGSRWTPPSPTNASNRDRCPHPESPRIETSQASPRWQSHYHHARTIDIPCDSIIIAAGCWTPRVYRALFPNAGRIPRITALAGHSIVMRTKDWPPQPHGSSPASRRNRHRHPRNSSRGSIPVPPLTDSVALSTGQNMTLNGRGASENGDTDIIPRGSGAAIGQGPNACHAIFTTDKAGFSPEIFSRLGGEIWLGGLNSSTIPLPLLPPSMSSSSSNSPTTHASISTASANAIQTLNSVGTKLLGPSSEVIQSGLCFRPVAPTGRPVIAKMHEADLGDGAKVEGGVYVVSGHGPWGISLSLGTGWVVGEMVLGRETSVDVSALGRWEAQAP